MSKPLVWLHGEIKTPPFSHAARVEAGFLLRRLQDGELLGMPASRPLPEVGAGCHELRIVDRDATWRIVYHVAEDAIVLLEIFQQENADVATKCGYCREATIERVSAGCPGGMT